MLAAQEATELSALFLRVETVFAGGDVPAIADMLATMRRSLLLVGDVPEFKGGMERLEVRSLSSTLHVNSQQAASCVAASRAARHWGVWRCQACCCAGLAVPECWC